MRSEKELYGAVADNNRGKWITNYYLEESDEENYIIPKLKEHIKEYGFLPKTFAVMIENIYFQVESNDYSYLESLFEIWSDNSPNAKRLDWDLTLEQAERNVKGSHEYHIRYEGKPL